jgi:hypothetical protein
VGGAGAGPLRVPQFVVIGGGPVGLVSVRQLLRAVAAGRLETDRIIVVDRDPGCAAGRARDGRMVLQTADWSEWLEGHLDHLGPADHLVPYHWAPHLLVTWLQGRARRAGIPLSRSGVIPPRGVPVERATGEGDRALSYATWLCPPTCIEPALCPHTRGPKDWSLAAHLEAGRAGDPFTGRIVFRCLHLVYGVGTIPIAEIRAAEQRLLAEPRAGRTWLVATSSHCHALATALTVGPSPGLGPGPEGGIAPPGARR